MEVVTLAKLWGRVGGNPHLSPPSRGAGGLRTSGLSLYICTTWGRHRSTEPKDTRTSVPFSSSLVHHHGFHRIQELARDRIPRSGTSPVPCSGP